MPNQECRSQGLDDDDKVGHPQPLPHCCWLPPHYFVPVSSPFSPAVPVCAFTCSIACITVYFRYLSVPVTQNHGYSLFFSEFCAVKDFEYMMHAYNVTACNFHFSSPDSRERFIYIFSFWPNFRTWSRDKTQKTNKKTTQNSQIKCC